MSVTMASSQASWMYTDPYAYQYSAVDSEEEVPTDSSHQSGRDTGSDPSELEGSTPLDTTRHELAATPVPKAVRDSQQAAGRHGVPGARESHKYLAGRARDGAAPAHTASASHFPIRAPPQPPSSGLIPVQVEAHTAAAAAQRYVPRTAAPCSGPRPSGQAYDTGLIPVDDNASTPKEPSSDFDAILRNIGPISKKGKGNTGRERSSRYYDRYSSNFG
ncbi:hypothetical protein F4802DRAFT_271674 [Xylaria palmicola]|nr:hypothetical protein F4802DRAFT_271674 [Xylaria palmicola]